MARMPYQNGTAGLPVDFSVALSSFDHQLHDKSVLITGGASGIGKACAEGFLKHGCWVTIADLCEDAVNKTKADIVSRFNLPQRIRAVACDVTSWESQKQLFALAAKHAPQGGIDIVLPCAGPRGGTWSFEPPKDIQSPTVKAPAMPCVSVALIGHNYTCQLALWYLLSNPQSLKCLIMMGSLSAYRLVPGKVDYTAAKYGTRGTFKALRDAPELCSYNQNRTEKTQASPRPLRVNYLAPGWIKTPMTEEMAGPLARMGIRMVPMAAVVDTVLRIAADSRIAGRSIGVSADGGFDMLDDEAHGNGSQAVKKQVWATKL